MNSFGSKFKVSLFGESHGEMIGVVMDGVPAGIALSEGDFEGDLARRRSGGLLGTTERREGDKPNIVSGLYNGFTTGAPLAILFRNEDARSDDYKELVNHPRPSHADWVANRRWGGFNDPRGGGHFSGRLTVALVAAGVVAKKITNRAGIAIDSRLVEVGGEVDSDRFESVVEAAIKDGDSVGGVVECVATGVGVGLGDPFFDSMESLIAHLLFSIPAVKGVEFGSGFAGSRMRGSQNNDPIISPDGRTKSNNAGGINGGLSNGNPIVVRVAVKPTPSISATQMTLNTKSNQVENLEINGRHDACIALRAPVIVESALAIVLAQSLPAV